jgi:hypothetical protein
VVTSVSYCSSKTLDSGATCLQRKKIQYDQQGQVPHLVSEHPSSCCALIRALCTIQMHKGTYGCQNAVPALLYRTTRDLVCLRRATTCWVVLKQSTTARGHSQYVLLYSLDQAFCKSLVMTIEVQEVRAASARPSEALKQGRRRHKTSPCACATLAHCKYCDSSNKLHQLHC